MRFVWPIARITLLEALRGRLVALVALGAVGAIALAAFLRQVAITESAEIQSSIIAAVLRLGAVFLLTTFAASSMVREWNDKGVELVLSHPVPRWAYVLGRYLGFAAAGVGIAAAFAVPLGVFAPADRVLTWAASLAMELALVAAGALFCALTLTSLVGALATVAGFYVLGRAIDAIGVIARATEGSGRPLERIADAVVTGIGMLLPHFDRMTQSAWLTDGPPAGALAGVFGQAAVYIALLIAAAFFDFQRRNF